MKKILISVALICCINGLAQALDESFGTNGKVVTELSQGIDGITEMILQTDGKIVGMGTANGYLQMARYDVAGVLDPSFGTGGIVNTGIVSNFSFLQGMSDLLQQPDGKILLLGNQTSNNRFEMFLYRFQSNGQLDTSFGNNGKINLNNLFSFSTSCYAVKLNLTFDGHLIATVTSQSQEAYLLRFLGNGQLDSSFGLNGISVVTVPAAYTSMTIRDAAIDPSGRTFFCVWMIDSNSAQTRFGLFQCHPDGTLNTGFANNGFAVTDLGTNQDYPESIDLQSDGKILVGGTSNYRFTLVRYLPNGSLDTSFNQTGIVTSVVGNYSDGSDLMIDSDGKILLAGNIGYDFGCIRYNPNGTVDTFFGTNGKYLIDFGSSSYDFGRVIAKQSDGKWVMAGMTSFMCSNRAFALTRFTLSTLSLEPNQSNSQWVIAPNPVRSDLSIDNKEGIESIKLFDLRGSLLENIEKAGFQTTLNLTAYPKGIYCLQLKSDGKITTKKIVKE